MASAAARTLKSSTSRPKTFQEFQPMGGARAKVSPLTILRGRCAMPSELMARRVTFHSPLRLITPVIRPEAGSSPSVFGNADAANFIGRSPVAGTVNKNGDPGRTPKTWVPLICGFGEGVGVRITACSEGGVIVFGVTPLTMKLAFAQSAWS